MAKEPGAQKERGAARIHQLTEMFPELPRQQVVMADLMIKGCRHTAALDEVGRWAWPDPHDHYDYDYDEHGEEELTGYVSHVPKHIYMANGRGFFLMSDAQSPYQVKYEGGGRYWLYRDEEPIEQVYFLPRPRWFDKVTSTGKPMNAVLFAGAREQSFQTYVTTYCEYFKDDCQCRFCNLNPTGERFGKVRGDKGPVKHEQDVYETYIAYAQEMGVQRVGLLGGSYYDRKKEADLYIRNIEVIQRAMKDCGIGCKNINLTNQAMEVEDQLRAKEVGVTDVSWHQEVWDPRLFEVICPGKAKAVGREHWMELLFRAVETFGWGKVSNSFIVGAETSPPYGDKTEEEEFESIAEGMRVMASHGVSTFLASLRGNPGSNLRHAQRPRIEHYLKMESECNKILQEHNLGPISLLGKLPTPRSLVEARA